MLYVTTRDFNDPQTAYKTLHADVAPDGGCFVPFRMEPFAPEFINSLNEKSFGHAIADVLNYFFSASVTGWDVEFCIGRNTFELFSLSSKIVLAKTWFNLGSSYDYIVDNLYAHICKDATPEKVPTAWSRIAIRIAVLFGVTGQIMRQGVLGSSKMFDLAVSSDDTSEVIAAWYAKYLGLPIGTILCGCSDSPIWDLLHRGALSTGQLTNEQSCGFELFIYAVLGPQESNTFRKCREARSVYLPENWLAEQLRSSFFASVVSNSRANAVINSVYRTDNTVIDPKTAIAYSVLQDYRARTGVNNTTLLVSDESPMKEQEQITKATGIAAHALAKMCDRY